ncbi:MAG TPA: hypothetical protein RMH85_35835 [Polyangiaceae bacterium LLY-WYZ-15_(1-7)]|nr:hypothetical protein [Polyangiaceae bacterium LLY-WYZ-15_(1-7)]HJL13913.1 hypothetical protein [Polyangiaceae bacterium LLY-WYZ-15_(1-7)]HJL25354.1 hypothetical protein [Polyangiaceae bacterium LLY-WYZ-15_(1-7)]HJL35427.1 hypothetical protein [Polyangiaceae bacterium LLY-WYZ-15_(1-7)]HJL49443.1 hypothetical protein [Polyangiaceae bacterium LLY-WYZ-15_(1-7)]
MLGARNAEVLDTGEVFCLLGGADLLHGRSRQAGLTRASIVATPRWVFLVAHDGFSVTPGVSAGREDALDVGQDRFEAWIRPRLAEPHAEVLERELRARTPPERALELARLGAFEMNGRTFAWKDPGAFTWNGVHVPVGAEALQAFLDRHRGTIAANAARIAAEPVVLDQRGRAPGVGLLAAGLALLGAVAFIALRGVGGEHAPWVAFLPLVFGLVLSPLGALVLATGRPIVQATGRPPGWWSSVNALIVAGGSLLALVAVLAWWAAGALGGS